MLFSAVKFVLKLSCTDNNILIPHNVSYFSCLFLAVLGVNICFIFFGWLLVIASLLLTYGTFKRQSRMCLPYMFALFETVLLIILLECLPEFIDQVCFYNSSIKMITILFKFCSLKFLGFC